MLCMKWVQFRIAMATTVGVFNRRQGGIKNHFLAFQKVVHVT